MKTIPLAPPVFPSLAAVPGFVLQLSDALRAHGQVRGTVYPLYTRNALLLAHVEKPRSYVGHNWSLA